MKSHHAGGSSEDSVRLLNLLSEAFPGTNERPDLQPPTHEQCVELRSKLIAMIGGDVLFYLREVLADLLKTHTGVPGNSEDSETVVQYLDASGEGVDPQFMEHQFGADAAAKHVADQQFLRHEKLRDFSRFTPKQAEAICQWLHHAKTWGDLKWNTQDIDRALVYWEAKAKL